MQILGSGILVIAISILLLTHNRQYLAISLGVHYAGIALMLIGVQSFETLLTEVVVGLTSAALVWLSAPVSSGSKKSSSAEAPLSPFFQLLTMVLCAMAALGLSSNYTIATNPAASNLNFVFFWMAAAGIMALSMTRSPFSVGCGLLLVLEAVQIAYLARTETVRPETLFAVVVVQFILILFMVRFSHQRADDPSTQNKSQLSIFVGRFLTVEKIYTPIILLLSIALLTFTLLASDALLTAIALTGVALLTALFMQNTTREQGQALKVMKFVALVTIAGACLQVAAILGVEFQLSREPILARIVVGFMVIGIAALAGIFPFHWWLLELPRRVTPIVAAILMGSISIALLVFLLQMLSSFPWLLSDQRSETILMALGVFGLCVTTLIALSRQDFVQLLMYTVAGHAGIILAGIAAGSYQGLIGATLLLINQILSTVILLLCVGIVARQRGKSPDQVSIEDLPTLTRESPILVLGIAIGSLTLLGLPPFAGFIGRWMVYVEISRQNTYLAVLVVGASILSLLSFVPVFQRLLQGLSIEGNLSLETPAFDSSQNLKLVPVPYRAIIVVLALLPLVSGVYPVPVLQAITDLLKGLQIAL